MLHSLQSECGGDSSLVTRGQGCQWSKPLIPEMCFNTQSNKMSDGGDGQLSNPHISEDGRSRLVSCTHCCVRVHTSKSLKVQYYYYSLSNSAVQYMPVLGRLH